MRGMKILKINLLKVQIKFYLKLLETLNSKFSKKLFRAFKLKAFLSFWIKSFFVSFFLKNKVLSLDINLKNKI